MAASSCWGSWRAGGWLRKPIGTCEALLRRLQIYKCSCKSLSCIRFTCSCKRVRKSLGRHLRLPTKGTTTFESVMLSSTTPTCSVGVAVPQGEARS